MVLGWCSSHKSTRTFSENLDALPQGKPSRQTDIPVQTNQGLSNTGDSTFVKLGSFGCGKAVCNSCLVLVS